MKRHICFSILICILSAAGLTAQTVIEEKIPTTRGRDNYSGSLLFMPDNSNLVSYNPRENKVRIRNLGTGILDSIEVRFEWDLSYIENIVATHDNSKIIIQVSSRHSPEKNYNSGFLGGGGDSIWQFETTLLCYSFPGKKLLWTISTGSKSYNALLIAPDDHVLCAVARMGANKFFDPETGRSLAVEHHFPNGINKNIVQSMDGKLVLFWTNAGFKNINLRVGSRLRLWDFDKGKKIASKFVKGKGVWAVAFNKEETGVFAGSFDGSVKEWSLIDNKLTSLLKDSNTIAFLACPASKSDALAVRTSRIGSTRLSIYSYPTIKPLAEFLLSDYSFTFGGGDSPRYAFSNSGRYFGLYHQDGGISVYRTDDWQPINLSPE